MSHEVMLEKEELTWIHELTKFPAAKPLVQHFSAFESILKVGGQKGIEPPIDQASTWRRMFCWELQRSDTPFGISSPTGKLPKCIAICNLSGHHSFYYSDSYNLGKVLCMSAQRLQSHITSGAMAVFDKAEELGASVLVCFCLPFQVGLERCYWEARTIRKTAKGVVKDGEMSFAISDREARVVSCTLASEHWPSEMFVELIKKLLSVVSPVCLDFTENSSTGMSQEKLEVALQILKNDRKKMMDQHKRELEEVKETSDAELLEQKSLVVLAEENANKRISQVISARNANESTLNKDIAKLKSDNSELLAKNALLNERIGELQPRLAGMKLEHETELSKASARQKTLQAQVSQLQSSHAKQVAEHSRQQQALKKSHQSAMDDKDAEINDLKRQVAAANSAASAVSAGAKQAHEISRRLEDTVKSLKLSYKVCLILLTSSSRRHKESITSLKTSSSEKHDNLTALIESLQKQLAVKDEESEKAKGSPKVEDKTTETECTPHEEQKPDDKLEMEHKKEMEAKDREIAEIKKHAELLENKVKEAEADVRKLKTTTAAVQPHGSNGKKKGQRSPDDSQSTALPANGPHQHLNISQNTAVFMGQPQQTLPHQQAFPQGNFVMDPALEGMVSQLHSALNCITAMARSSSSHKRAADVANGKLEALTAQGYYEPAYMPQQQFYTNGY